MKCEYCDTNEATLKDYRDFYDGVGFSKYFSCDSCFYESNRTVKSMMNKRFKKLLDKSSPQV